MNKYTRLGYFILVLLLSPALLSAENHQNRWKPDWLAVSDREELQRTWDSSLVYLPESVGEEHGRLLLDESGLSAKILNTTEDLKLPLILFLHACEGLGHHRDDLLNYAKLGFAVIALDSFARNHRPLGCYEEQERYIKYYDIAVAFQKAELDYAVERIKALPWVDSEHTYLIGSGIGGMVVAHYQGVEFSGHVIEGWGCHHAHDVFNGIWTPPEIPVLSVVSKNDPWFKDVPGFEIDCKRYLDGRTNGISIELDRPAHYVGWYKNSRTTLIKFLTQGMQVDQSALIDDTPKVINSTPNAITLKVKWSLDAVYEMAKAHCLLSHKTSHLVSNEPMSTYGFVCD